MSKDTLLNTKFNIKYYLKNLTFQATKQNGNDKKMYMVKH